MHKKIKISNDLLKALNYESIDEAALDMIFVSARSRYSEFGQELKQFEKKYHMNFESFKEMIEETSNQEDFQKEDDLMAWKFAKEGAEYWRLKIEEIENVV